MKIAYIEKKFGVEVLKTIATVNSIIETYRKQALEDAAEELENS